MEQVGGEEEGVVRASGATEAAGQIDLDDADCSAALEEGPGDEPQSRKRDPVSAAAVINLKTGTLKPRPGGGQGGLRIHNFHPKKLNSSKFMPIHLLDLSLRSPPRFNYVRKFLGILDPLPPLCSHFTQPISTVIRKYWSYSVSKSSTE